MRFSELDDARIGVWGAGREIASFVSQLTRRLPSARIAVAAFDEPPGEQALAALSSSGARVVVGTETLEALSGCEVLVRSPGVSIHRPEMIALRERGVRVTTATSLWLAERGGRRTIGVTGTKGKSTTAALIHHLALAAGEPARLAGNIGLPALDLLDGEPDALAVVELSSYQVADLEIGPEVAVLTNLFREHSDWHGSEANYRAEKLRLLQLEGVRAAVLPARLPSLAQAPVRGRRLLFGEPAGWDVGVDGVSFEGELKIAAGELALPGEHNALNLCAALTALEAAGIAPPEPAGALEGFKGLDHRLQTIVEREGVVWVNDSISTTPESTLAALASFPERALVLLAGGQDRGQDYSALGAELARLGATVIGLPTTGEGLLQAARAAGVPDAMALAAEDLQDAVRLACDRARPGTVVLLSPAAPSYDHYANFEQRGERFGELALAAGA